MLSYIERRAAATPRVTVKNGRVFWEPSKSLRERGFKGHALGPISKKALNAADFLNEKADLCRTRPHPQTVAEAVSAYLVKVRVRSATLRNYRRYLGRLASSFGDMPLTNLNRARLRQWYEAIPREQDALNHMAAVVTFLNWAHEADLIASADAASFRRPSRGRRNRVATRDEYKALIRAADAMDRPSVALAVVLLLTTMQRPSDVLSLTYDHLRAGVLYLQQAKTGREVSFPLHSAAVDRMGPQLTRPASPRPMIRSEITGKAYTLRSFQRAFAKVRQRAAAQCPSLVGADPTVHGRNFEGALRAADLRRSGMVWAAEGGANIAEIASVSGHSIDRGTQILETYLPRTFNLARRTIAKLNLHRIPTVEEIDRAWQPLPSPRPGWIWNILRSRRFRR